MRNIFIIFVVIVALSCSNGNGTKGGLVDSSDSIMIIEGPSEDLGYGMEYTYYAVNGNDTMSLSCELFDMPEKKEMNIIFRNLYCKVVIPSDTSVFDKNAHINSGYKRANYQQQLYLIGLFLERISATNDIGTLTFLDYGLLSSGSLNVEVSSGIARMGQASMKDVIKSSSFCKTMNVLLRNYGLEIDDVSIGKFVFVDKRSFLLHNSTDSLDIRDVDKFLDATISLKIHKLQR